MNLTLNSLPSRTWNRLGMNESRLELEAITDYHSPDARWEGEELHWDPAAVWSGPEVPSGLGADVEKLTAGAPVGLAETVPDSVMKGSLVLRWDWKENERSAARVVLHAARNSTLNAILVLAAPEADQPGTAVVSTGIVAEENAVVNVYVAQLLGSGSLCLTDLSGTCADGASVHLTRLDLGAGRAYVGTSMDLKGRESRFTADTAYHVLPGQLLDMNYVALHRGQRTESLMEVNGTLEENARKVFRGSIDFRRGCAGSKGTENENVLLLSDELVNQTIPLILCKEEDVEGNHGASIGKLDDSVLFYLASRGIDPAAAQQLLAQARIEAVCARIPDEAVRQEIRALEQKRCAVHD